MQYMKLTDIKPLENNPRIIKDEDMKRLRKSITDNPDFFEARPIICSDRTGELVIIGGNMRYRAAELNGLTEVPVYVIHGLTEGLRSERKSLLFATTSTMENSTGISWQTSGRLTT